MSDMRGGLQSRDQHGRPKTDPRTPVHPSNEKRTYDPRILTFLNALPENQSESILAALNSDTIPNGMTIGDNYVPLPAHLTLEQKRLIIKEFILNLFIDDTLKPNFSLRDSTERTETGQQGKKTNAPRGTVAVPIENLLDKKGGWLGNSWQPQSVEYATSSQIIANEGNKFPTWIKELKLGELNQVHIKNHLDVKTFSAEEILYYRHKKYTSSGIFFENSNISNTVNLQSFAHLFYVFLKLPSYHPPILILDENTISSHQLQDRLIDPSGIYFINGCVIINKNFISKLLEEVNQKTDTEDVDAELNNFNQSPNLLPLKSLLFDKSHYYRLLHNNTDEKDWSMPIEPEKIGSFITYCEQMGVKPFLSASDLYYEESKPFPLPTLLHSTDCFVHSDQQENISITELTSSSYKYLKALEGLLLEDKELRRIIVSSLAIYREHWEKTNGYPASNGTMQNPNPLDHHEEAKLLVNRIRLKYIEALKTTFNQNELPPDFFSFLKREFGITKRTLYEKLLEIYPQIDTFLFPEDTYLIEKAMMEPQRCVSALVPSLSILIRHSNQNHDEVTTKLLENLSTFSYPVASGKKDIHHLGLAIGFYQTYQELRGKDGYIPIVKVHSMIPLAQNPLTHKTDGEPSFTQKLHADISQQIRSGSFIGSENKDTQFYNYESGELTLDQFREIVINSLNKGYRIYPIVNWEQYTPGIANIWGSTLHVIEIQGIDKDENLLCLDGAFPMPNGITHNGVRTIEQIFNSLQNQQFIILGEEKQV